MIRPDAIGLPGLAAFALGGIAFAVALIAARARRGTNAGERGAAKSSRSILGIAVQGVAIFLVAAGPQNVTLDPLSAKALVEAVAVTLLMATTVALFAWASQTMGRNWSLVARTRSDHSLVQTGPFAHIRHPIYTALALMMVAIAIAFGHSGRLLLGVPLYALGTWLRIHEEERLLRTMFGATYDAYAARVKRFVPGLF